MNKTVYLFADVEGLAVQSLRAILSEHLPEKTYVGTNYDEKNTDRENHVILNIQSASERAQGALRLYTCSGVIVSPTRGGAVQLNELVIGGMRALPRKMTILKHIEVSNGGTQIESGDGQKYMRGFNVTFLIKANQKTEFNF